MAFDSERRRPTLTHAADKSTFEISMNCLVHLAIEPPFSRDRIYYNFKPSTRLLVLYIIMTTYD